jgi:hypothetical protein
MYLPESINAFCSVKKIPTYSLNIFLKVFLRQGLTMFPELALNFSFYILLLKNVIIILLSYWRYIVTFTKVLTIYLSGLKLFIHLLQLPDSLDYHKGTPGFNILIFLSGCGGGTLLATLEAEIRWIMVQGQPWPKPALVASSCYPCYARSHR